MVLAHMRGLLKPDYPQGMQSWIREKYVLEALEREASGHGFMTRAIIDGASLPVCSPESRQRTYHRAVSFTMQATALLQCAPYDYVLKLSEKTQNWSEIKKIASLFKVLKKTNFYEMMHGVLKQTRNLR